MPKSHAGLWWTPRGVLRGFPQLTPLSRRSRAGALGAHCPASLSSTPVSEGGGERGCHWGGLGVSRDPWSDGQNWEPWGDMWDGPRDPGVMRGCQGPTGWHWTALGISNYSLQLVWVSWGASEDASMTVHGGRDPETPWAVGGDPGTVLVMWQGGW